MKSDVTLVVTSCGRADLLERTLKSFWEFNTYPVKATILIEDGPAMKPNFLVPDLQYMVNQKRTGQVASIDRAYAQVDTAYIFHCEDDWEFYKPGFMEASLDVLEKYPKILQVWIRAHNDTNGHPIEQLPEFDIPTMALGYLGQWNGFAWNPGLRRFSDYERIGSYMQHVTSGRYTESLIGEIYRDLGYRAAILPEVSGYVRHIGQSRSLPYDGLTDRGT